MHPLPGSKKRRNTDSKDVWIHNISRVGPFKDVTTNEEKICIALLDKQILTTPSNGKIRDV